MTYLCTECGKPFEKGPDEMPYAGGLDTFRPYKGDMMPDILCYFCDECVTKLTVQR